MTRYDLIQHLLLVHVIENDTSIILCCESCISLLRVLKIKGLAEIKNKVASSIVDLLYRIDDLFLKMTLKGGSRNIHHHQQQHQYPGSSSYGSVEYHLTLLIPTLFTVAVNAVPLLYELKRRTTHSIADQSILALGATRLSTLVMKKDDLGLGLIEEIEACQKIVGVVQ
jgi:hypothetical protein